MTDYISKENKRACGLYWGEEEKGLVIADKTHDCDSTRDVWENLYHIIYKNTFGHLFDFESIDDKETNRRCKRWYVKIDREKQPALAKEFPKFKMAGDCIFNFNDKKVELIRNIIGDCENELLAKCKSNHHSLLNYSFMPITGGLNATKGIIRCENGIERKPFDRPDVLIAELQKYYQGIPTRLFRNTNREALKWYLNIFAERGIAGYCNDIYLIDDEEMIQRFLKLSKKAICNLETASEYMMLACDYWKMKEIKLKEFGISEFSITGWKS